MGYTNKPQHLRLSENEFKESFRLVPRIAVNLLITDSGGRILLTKRNIPPFLGFWHFPGSYLLKNEQLIDVQKRVAKKEFGLFLDSAIDLTLLGVFEDLEGDPRGHVIDLMYGLQINDTSQIKPTIETSEVRFFNRDKLPKDIGFNHRDTLHKLGYTDE